MFDETGEGFVSAFESLAKTFVVAAVLWWLFLILAWPFINVSRFVCFCFSLGHVAPTYRQSLEHQGILIVAFLIFLPAFFYLHLVYGATLYGNLSN